MLYYEVMKVVIVGIGKIGEPLATRLLKEKHDVTVVDEDYQRVDDIVNRSDVKGVVGNCLERHILSEAEVDKADFFFACTPRDELNILSAVLAKKMGARKVVARVRDPKYLSSLESLKDVLGVDMIFNPEYRTALEIRQILKFPSAISAAGSPAGSAAAHAMPQHRTAASSIARIFFISSFLLLTAPVSRSGRRNTFPRPVFCIVTSGPGSPILRYSA